MLIRYTSPPNPSALTRRGADLLTQVFVLGGLWLGYRGARLVGGHNPGRALENAQDVLRIERWLPLPSELHLQRLALNWIPGVKAANLFYISVHFPVTLIFLAWVWARHRHFLPRVRSVLIILTASALAVHILYPLAPPRLTAGYGFIDTGALVGPSPYRHGLSALANQFAAMPSLHIGWAVVVAWAGRHLLVSRRARLLVCLHPTITTLVVVVTANHYWLDGLAAVGLFSLAVLITRPRDASRCRMLEARSERELLTVPAGAAGTTRARSTA